MGVEPVKPRETAPIRIAYRESGDHLREGLEQLPPFKLPSQMRWIIVAVVAIVGLTFLQQLIGERPNWTAYTFTMAPVAIILILVLWFIRSAKAGLGKRDVSWYRERYRKETGRDETRAVCEFGDAGVFTSGESGAAAHYPWHTVVRVIERPKGLLVYSTPEVFHWFPKPAFTTEADYAAVIRLIESKVRDFQKLN